MPNIRRHVRSKYRRALAEALECRRLLSTIAHWRFEEGAADAAASSAAGAILDSSGNGHHATAVAGPLYRDFAPIDPLPQTGVADKRSLDFNGTSQRITVADSSAFQLTHSLTLEAFINLRNIPDTDRPHYIVFRGDDRASFDPYWLGVVKTGGKTVVRFFIDNGDGNILFIESPIQTNQWTHVAGTLDDATGAMKLYVNGQLKASITTTYRAFGSLNGANPGIGIGNLQSGLYSQYFDGLIDEVRISNSALTPSQFLSTKPNSANSITGRVFNDTNSDGSKQANEAGLSGWTVYLDTNNNGVKDASEISTTTDASGNYAFTNLAAGTYRVREVLKSGYRKSNPVGVPGYDITLASGDAATLRDFGNTTNILIGGVVYDDINGDGVRQSYEPGLSGFVVNIVSNNTIIATRTTDLNGQWQVKGLPAGSGYANILVQGDYSATSSPNFNGSMTSGQANANLNVGVRHKNLPYVISGPVINPSNGHQYYLLSVSTWSDAEAVAQRMGGHLATIRNASENTFVHTVFGTSKYLWIGINDVAEEGTFTWVSGETSTYTNWASGEPSNHSASAGDPRGKPESFGMIYDEFHAPNGGWNDAEYAAYPVYGVVEINTPTSVLAGPITNPANGHQYYLLTPGTWTDAEAKAKSLGGHLVTINNKAENDWVHSTFNKFGGYFREIWLGLNDAASEGVFAWSSGEPVTYVNWRSGQPNNGGGNENYISMHSDLVEAGGVWSDLPNGQYPEIYGVVEVAISPAPLAAPVSSSGPLFSTRVLASDYEPLDLFIGDSN